MENIEPEYIYHYTKTRNLFLILFFMHLKMSNLEETNDPRERLKYIEGVFQGNDFSQNECIQLIEKFRNNYPTITCFSGDSEDKKGFNLPTMWAHYADSHKGICMKINTRKFIKENENLNCNFRGVKYISKTKFNWFEISEATSKDDILEDLVFSKRDDWSSENEWRLFSLEGVGFCSVANSLESIILGLDFDISSLPLIRLLKGETIKIEKILVNDQTQDFYIEQLVGI